MWKESKGRMWRDLKDNRINPSLPRVEDRKSRCKEEWCSGLWKSISGKGCENWATIFVERKQCGQDEEGFLRPGG